MSCGGCLFGRNPLLILWRDNNLYIRPSSSGPPKPKSMFLACAPKLSSGTMSTDTHMSTTTSTCRSRCASRPSCFAMRHYSGAPAPIVSLVNIVKWISNR